MMTGIVRRRTSLLRAACAAALLFALYVPAAFAQEQVIYYKTDAIGSVRMITDANGQVLQRYDYLPFGDPWPSQSDLEDPRRFAGQERDSETALDYSGARHYESQTGRFTSPDVPGIDQDPFDPQSWNLYTYVRNNPVRYTDPDGRKCVNGKDPDTGNFCAEDSEIDAWAASQRFFRDSSSGNFVLFQPQASTSPPNLIGAAHQYWEPFQEGFKAAKRSLQKDKCKAFYGGQGSARMDATQYRFADLNNVGTGAATFGPTTVLINSKGAYMTYVPNSGGVGPFGRFWTQTDFRGFILLHELGHQLSDVTGFVPDAADSRLNTAQSRRVLSACY